MKPFLLFATIALLAVGCASEPQVSIEEAPDLGNATDLFDNIYNPSAIEAQSFSIAADRDTTLIGANGTVLRIFENSFVDAEGNSVEGEVEVTLKEAYSKRDIVMGNLVTTYNGMLLESDGMLMVEATAAGQKVELANDKVLGVSVPTEDLDNNMRIFEAEPCPSGDNACGAMNWVSPKRTLNKKIKRQQRTNRWVTYYPDESATDKENRAVLDYVWDNDLWDHDGEKISHGGATIEIVSHRSVPIEIITTEYDDGRIVQEVLAPPGVNAFVSDLNTSYIFSMANLGWANIDRLYEDPRSAEVDLVTDITNDNEFHTVYVTLIFKNQNIFLNGYKTEQGGYCFSHGDFEKTVLPIGEDVTIMATAYKADSTYFAHEKITISDSLNLNLELAPTTMDKLESFMASEI